jgi:hypothetical protein
MRCGVGASACHAPFMSGRTQRALLPIAGRRGLRHAFLSSKGEKPCAFSLLRPQPCSQVSSSLRPLRLRRQPSPSARHSRKRTEPEHKQPGQEIIGNTSPIAWRERLPGFPRLRKTPPRRRPPRCHPMTSAKSSPNSAARRPKERDQETTGNTSRIACPGRLIDLRAFSSATSVRCGNELNRFSNGWSGRRLAAP